MKFLHFSDAHIDAVQTGKWDPDTGFPIRVMDFLKSLDTIVDTAITEEVDVVFFAGDAFKDRNPLPQYQAEFARRILKLEAAKIPTYLLVGNHDKSTRTRSHALLDFITFQTKYVQVIDELSFQKVQLDDWGFDLIALPWIHKSRLQQSEVISKIEEMIEDLDPETPNIFLGHCSVSGVQYSTGQMATLGADLMLPKPLLTQSGFDYVALGHIHKPQTMNEDPPVIYPGSIERVDWGEAGEDKFFIITELFYNGDPEIEWRKLDIRSFKDYKIILEDKDRIIDQVIETIDEGSAGDMVRIKLEYPEQWSSLINNQEIENLFPEALSVQVVHEPIRTNQARLDLDKGIEEYAPDKLLELYLEDKGFQEDEKQEVLEAGRKIMSLEAE